MSKSTQQTFHLIGKKFKTEDLLLIVDTETPYQIDRLSQYLKTFEGKPFKLVITPTKRPKSKEALGMYFGCLVPATALDMLDLPYDVEKVYDDFNFYKGVNKIHNRHLLEADEMLRLEWHYTYSRRLNGTLTRIPKDLSTESNGALLMLIEKIMEWRSQNGYPLIDVEKYKERRDRADLI